MMFLLRVVAVSCATWLDEELTVRAAEKMLADTEKIESWRRSRPPTGEKPDAR